MKHGFKSKQKRTPLTKEWPWWFTSHQFEQERGHSLPLSWWKMGYSAHHIVCDPFPFIACPLSVCSSFWKNTWRLATGIYRIVTGSSLFTEGRKPHLWYTLGQSTVSIRRPVQVPLGWEIAYTPRIPSAQRRLYSPHITESISREHHTRISNHLWQGDAPCIAGLTKGSELSSQSTLAHSS